MYPRLVVLNVQNHHAAVLCLCHSFHSIDFNTMYFGAKVPLADVNFYRINSTDWDGFAGNDMERKRRLIEDLSTCSDEMLNDISLCSIQFSNESIL